MRRHIITVVYVVGMIVSIVVLVYGAGGTSTSLPHLMYVPITLAGIRGGQMGGLLTGLGSSISMMLLPLHVEGGVSQPLTSVIVRSSAYLLMGYSVGYMVQKLQEHQATTEDSFLQSVSALVNMLEVNHKYTAGHSVRVAQISRALATEMACSSNELFLITVGALLHDVGKVAIPKEILDKPLRLTADEFTLVKTHPAEGERILASLEYAGAAVIRDIVRHHHERLDGSGYPDALTGAQLTRPVRVVAVADVFEALTADRPYRAGMSPEAALEIIQRETARGRFDPAVVRCLNTCVAQHPQFFEGSLVPDPLLQQPHRFSAAQARAVSNEKW